MGVGNIDEDTRIDLKEAEEMGIVSDKRLMLASLIFILSSTASLIFVCYNSFVKKYVWLNIVILVSNMILMMGVVFIFNKYKN